MTAKFQQKPIEWVEDNNGCFLCTSHSKNNNGYVWRKRKHLGTSYMHRFVYEEMFGEIPEGMVIRHKCDNPSCINPEHLEIGTQNDNVQDMKYRGRSNKGKSYNKRLSDEDVKLIRSIKDKTQSEIARMFNTSPSNISSIKNFKSRCFI